MCYTLQTTGVVCTKSLERSGSNSGYNRGCLYIPIIRWDDHPQYKEFRPLHIWSISRGDTVIPCEILPEAEGCDDRVPDSAEGARTHVAQDLRFFSQIG